MTRKQTVARLVHEAPDGLPDPEDDDAAQRMREAFADRVDQFVGHHESDDIEQVAVQGKISSMKSWLATFAAKRFQERGEAVTILVPQRVNRGDIADRLKEHDVPFIEQPSRRDLCAWDDWLDRVGYVDEGVCSNNGCSLYPTERDLEAIAREALSKHRFLDGQEPIQLDLDTAKELSQALDTPVCPFYLMNAVDSRVDAEDAVRVATVEKAFSCSGTDQFNDADVLLLDEAHTVSADTERLKTSVDVQVLVRSASRVADHLRTSVREQETTKLALEGLRDILSDWADNEKYDPEGLFEMNPDLLSVGFETVRDAEEALQTRAERGNGDATKGAIDAYRSLGVVREFLSELARWSEGERDFVHIRHDADGGSIERAYFRLVDDEQRYSALDSLYSAWETQGTHPAIRQRWGGLLEKHLRGIHEGRSVSPGGDRALPKPVPRPLDLLQRISGAKTLIGFSATHNDASDSARDRDELRSTQHSLVGMPIRLRTDRDDAERYQGGDTVDPNTPWFRRLLEESQKETGASLAVVPVNTRNRAKWKGLPVRGLSVPDGSGGQRVVRGLVPNSRAAIGSKDLEQEDIDAVLCGIQVQSPNETACRLLELWEMVEPEHDDPKDALSESWRLLAQRAVAGTIQAGGRFDSEASNLVFDHAELLELAGFESEMATAESPGFAGELVKRFDELCSSWKREMQVLRAKKVVGHLIDHDSKSPTSNQYLSSFQERYSEGEEDAKDALLTAVDEGAVVYTGDRLRLSATRRPS